MPPIDTPCTKVCTLDPRLRICIGCGRSAGEIERWTRLSRQERLNLMAKARERLHRLRAAPT